MERDKNVNYLTKAECMDHFGMVWIFIMLTLVMTILGEDQAFQFLLLFVSFVTAVSYMVYARTLKRSVR